MPTSTGDRAEPIFSFVYFFKIMAIISVPPPEAPHIKERVAALKGRGERIARYQFQHRLLRQRMLHGKKNFRCGKSHRGQNTDVDSFNTGILPQKNKAKGEEAAY